MDLTDPANIGRSRDCRFLQRVFTIREQEQIAGAKDPDRLIWAFWAGKETAYKVIRKGHPEVASTPKRYDVELSLPANVESQIFEGFVRTPMGPVVIRILSTADCLHSIGSLTAENLDQVIWQIERLSSEKDEKPPDPSKQIRDLIKRKMADLLHVSFMETDIRRYRDAYGYGPPLAYLKNQPAPLDLSISHDGDYMAYAILAS